MEVTEALASCLLVTGQQCEMNQMNDLESQQMILREFQRCMQQVVQSALGRPGRFDQRKTSSDHQYSIFSFVIIRLTYRSMFSSIIFIVLFLSNSEKWFCLSDLLQQTTRSEQQIKSHRTNFSM